jgi:hypothetical protein
MELVRIGKRERYSEVNGRKHFANINCSCTSSRILLSFIDMFRDIWTLPHHIRMY